ncbi:hypothetical protein RMQ97_13490 [Maricaulis sp. D1M11]|uniref:hypothetical protein n=1 Tax=Maricaulis sp. D1M11 TaxID=3076117 RepID=UPI0039B5DE7C
MAASNPDTPVPAHPTELLDLDIVSFCARRPDLTELAFTLADHGHVYLGDVVRLSEYTVLDLANGRRDQATMLRLMLNQCGLRLDLPSPDWQAPANDLLASELD